MDAARPDGPCAVLLEGLRGIAQRARRVDHVIHDEAVRVPHVADDAQDVGDIRGGSALVNDGQGGVQRAGEPPCALNSARVRRDYDQAGVARARGVVLEVLQQDGHGEDVVDGEVEEALDLAGVQLEGEDAVDAGGLDEVSEQAGRDGDARVALAVLARVAVVGDDGGDALGRGAREGVREEQQLHDVVVDRRGRRLDDEDVLAAHGVVDGHARLAIREGGDGRRGERQAQVRGDLARERAVRRAGEDADFVVESLVEGYRGAARGRREDWRRVRGGGGGGGGGCAGVGHGDGRGGEGGGKGKEKQRHEAKILGGLFFFFFLGERNQSVSALLSSFFINGSTEIVLIDGWVVRVER